MNTSENAFSFIENFEKFLKTLEEYNEIERENRLKRHKKVQENLRALRRKSKELKEEIPDELYMTIYIDQPVGAWFVEKYKKWLT